MGGFFLFDNNAIFHRNNVADHFENAGFADKSTFTLGQMELWLYKKQLLNEKNWHQDENKSLIFSAGSPVYKGLSPYETLRHLLKDFKTDVIDFNQLIGAYCIIFFHNNQISILLDPLCMYHVFIDDTEQFISSSFCPILVANSEKSKLNHLACIENLATGYVIGPDTLAENVRVVSRPISKNRFAKSITFIHSPFEKEIVSYYGKFNDCVDDQLECLKSNISQTSRIAEKYGADCGISGGYDSRLLLALICDVLPIRPVLHTHAVEGHHTKYKEKSVAEQIGQVLGLSVKSISAVPAEQMDECQIIRNLNDSIYYYDGRSNHVMGSYHTTNTSAYRKAILKEIGAGYNGLTGELFRKFDHVRQREITFDRWAHLYLMYPGFFAASAHRQIACDLFEYINGKIKAILGVPHFKKLNAFDIRRYVGEVKNVYNYGTRINAENQLAYFFTPFSDAHIVSRSYSALPFIGNTGKFQSAMIDRLDSRLSRITSNYGFPFHKEPLLYRAERALRAFMPFEFAKFKVNRKAYQEKHYVSYCYKMIDKSIIIRKSIKRIESSFPDIQWKKLMCYPYQFDCSVFVGHVLNSYF